MTDVAFDYRGAREAFFSSTLPGALKLLGLALVEFMPHCCPSVLTLAAHCGVERKTVLRALARLERAGVLRVERTPGRRSRYHLQPVPSWRTGTNTPPVPIERTRPESPPVPTETGTGTNQDLGPVPTKARTSPTAKGPEAVEADPESGVKRGARAAFDAVSRTLTMPSEVPTGSYLAACTMAGVRPEQAKGTWAHYWGAGLPPGGVERLEAWLALRAKERQDKLEKLPPRAGSPRPMETVDTTGAATAFKTTWEHDDFAKKHLPGHDLVQLAFKCRQVPRFAALDTASQDREFMARLRHLKRTGMFFADGPLPRPPKEMTP